MRRTNKITLASKPTYNGYSHAFKMAIIERIENGQLSINQAAKEYLINKCRNYRTELLLNFVN